MANNASAVGYAALAILIFLAFLFILNQYLIPGIFSGVINGFRSLFGLDIRPLDLMTR